MYTLDSIRKFVSSLNYTSLPKVTRNGSVVNDPAQVTLLAINYLLNSFDLLNKSGINHSAKLEIRSDTESAKYKERLNQLEKERNNNKVLNSELKLIFKDFELGLQIFNGAKSNLDRKIALENLKELKEKNKLIADSSINVDDKLEKEFKLEKEKLLSECELLIKSIQAELEPINELLQHPLFVDFISFSKPDAEVSKDRAYQDFVNKYSENIGLVGEIHSSLRNQNNALDEQVLRLNSMVKSLENQQSKARQEKAVAEKFIEKFEEDFKTAETNFLKSVDIEYKEAIDVALKAVKESKNIIKEFRAMKEKFEKDFLMPLCEEIKPGSKKKELEKIKKLLESEQFSGNLLKLENEFSNLLHKANKLLQVLVNIKNNFLDAMEKKEAEYLGVEIQNIQSELEKMSEIKEEMIIARSLPKKVEDALKIAEKAEDQKQKAVAIQKDIEERVSGAQRYSKMLMASVKGIIEESERVKVENLPLVQQTVKEISGEIDELTNFVEKEEEFKACQDELTIIQEKAKEIDERLEGRVKNISDKVVGISKRVEDTKILVKQKVEKVKKNLLGFSQKLNAVEKELDYPKQHKQVVATKIEEKSRTKNGLVSWFLSLFSKFWNGSQASVSSSLVEQKAKQQPKGIGVNGMVEQLGGRGINKGQNNFTQDGQDSFKPPFGKGSRISSPNLTYKPLSNRNHVTWIRTRPH